MITIYRWNRRRVGRAYAAWLALLGTRLPLIHTARPLWCWILRGQRG